MKDSNDTEWTDEDLKIAIGYACGWIMSENGKFAIAPDGNCRTIGFPNYPSDLNACHEMEKVLTHAAKNLYIEELGDMCGTRGMVMATASQRCIAFVQTLGLSPEKKD